LLVAGFYELFRDMLTKPGGNVSDLSVWHVFTAGGAAGVLFWALTYPTDVIKSTLQSDELERSQRKYNGIIDCAKKMYYNEGGIKRFFRGFSPCLLRAIPANAAMLYTVERARQFLNPYI
jgi:solute carrier family 25 (mitochondrial carnitine/acylcarnitine transporter), member 20/29